MRHCGRGAGSGPGGEAGGPAGQVPLLGPAQGAAGGRLVLGTGGPVDLQVRDLELTGGTDIAFGHSLNRLSAVPRGSTEGFAMWYRSTVCLRKLDGRWLITHEHTSTPFHMDGSFLAATDLQP